MMVPAMSWHAEVPANPCGRVHSVLRFPSISAAKQIVCSLVGTYLVPTIAGYIQCLENISKRRACAS